MNADPLDLAAHFRDMSDGELAARCSSGNLTEQAQAIADAERSARGLEATAPVLPPAADLPYAGDFKTVAQFLSPTDAFVVASCLEAAGIPAFVADANLVQANSLLAIAVGGVRVRVPTAHVAEAQEVIAAFHRGDYALLDDDTERDLP